MPGVIAIAAVYVYFLLFAQYGLLRLLGHTLAVVIFLWLAGALYASAGHNRAYLQSVRQKAGALAATVAAFYKAQLQKWYAANGEKFRVRKYVEKK